MRHIHCHLAFIGLSKAKSRALLDCQERYPDTWIHEWLKDQGFSEWAKIYQNAFFQNDKN